MKKGKHHHKRWCFFISETHERMFQTPIAVRAKSTLTQQLIMIFKNAPSIMLFGSISLETTTKAIILYSH